MVTSKRIDLNFNFKWSLFKEKNLLPKGDLLFRILQIFFAEFLGTMMLLFWGCSTIGHLNTGEPIVISWLWGNVVFIAIQIFGPISNCHINPAVTLSFFIFGYVSLFLAFVYVIAQILGAMAGYAMLMTLGSDDLTNYGSFGDNFCVTMVKTTPFRGMVLEGFATALLCLFIGRICDPLNPKGIGSISFLFSLLITIICYALGPVTGASINPARSLAPAIINNQFTDHWVYWVGPLLGSTLSSFLYHIFFLPKAG